MAKFNVVVSLSVIVEGVEASTSEDAVKKITDAIDDTDIVVNLGLDDDEERDADVISVGPGKAG